MSNSSTERSNGAGFRVFPHLKGPGWLRAFSLWSLLFVLSGPLAVWAAAQNGPVAYWSFDQDFSATAGGSTFDGLPVNGVTIDAEQSRFGGASARFVKGDAQHVRIDSSPFTQGSYTFAAWYFLDVEAIGGMGDANRYFVLESAPAWSASYSLRYDPAFAGTLPDGNVGSVLSHDNAASGLTSHFSFSSGAHQQWRHIAVTYDADRLRLDAYLDGVSVGSVQLRSTASRISPTNTMTIGGHREGGRNWEGWIDEVAVWDRVLNPDEIAFLQANPVSELAPPPPGDVFALYLAPDGNDDNSGLDPANPILTLGRANTIVRDTDPQMDVEIRIAPGTYRGQGVSWRRTHPEFRTTFTPYPYDAERPVFDGCVDDNDCPGGTWFRIAFSQGTFSGTEPTNLEFLNLEVRNYETAIAFDGDRHKPETGFSSHNLVSGCRFYRIGNVFNPNRPRSTAAIRLINSKENIFKNNDFEMIANADPGDFSSLHAIYITHHSERNVIAQNRFIDNTGDAVRIRDASHENIVLDNVFLRAGKYGYSDWYCDSDVRDDCTKLFPECPSWGGRFHENVLLSRGDNAVIGASVLYQGDISADCLPAAPYRVSDARNLYPSPALFDLSQHRELDRFERPAPGDPADALVYFDLRDVPTAWQPAAEATTVAEGLSVADLVRGPGLTPSNLNRGFSANNWVRTVPSRATALANGDYFEFAVTVQPGYTASLAGLDHSLRRSATHSPMNFEWQYSFDGFATSGQTIVPQGSIWDDLGWTNNHFTYFGRSSTAGCSPDGYNYMLTSVCDQNEGNPMPRFELGGFSNLQNIAEGTTVTLRLYAWANQSTASSNSLGIGREIGPMLTGTVSSTKTGDSFGDWRERHFPGQTSDDAISGPNADPLENGINNFMSYFLGLDPWSPAREKLPAGKITSLTVNGSQEDYLTLSFTRPSERPGASHRVWATGDLGAWPDDAELHVYQDNGDGTATEVWRDLQPVAQTSRRFLKLEVSRK